MTTSINIYVDGGDFAAPYYNFYTDDAGTQVFDQQFDGTKTYNFHRLNGATSHPFYISTATDKTTNGITISGDGSSTGGIYGTQTFTLEFTNQAIPTTLYYFCTAHDSMYSQFTYSVPCPCFTDSCDILTPQGYKNISELKVSDMVMSGDKQVKVLQVITSISHGKPHMLPKHSLDHNMPSKDTFISFDHKYMKDGVLVCGGKEGEFNGDTVVYYHVKVEGNGLLMVNGVEMESWDGKL